MYNIGARILYDTDGEIVTVLNEFSSETISSRKKVNEIRYVDLPYGYLQDKLVTGYDVSKNKLIYKTISIESDEQKRIKELEDILLLKTDSEIGGIL